MIRIALLFSLLSVLLSPSARAAGDAAAGKDLATTWCSACHLMEGGQTTADGARPFAAMARDPKVTADRLHAFLVKPHGQMPELNLTRQEIENLVAYIESLK
jgi:mono/diheme cytochrome c family protein